MFRRRQQQYTGDEFVRYFAGRVEDERIPAVVYEQVRSTAKAQFVSPFESLAEHHGIAGSDLDELVQSILAELGLQSTKSDHFGERPDVRTIEGLVLLVDFAYRLEKNHSV
jgi:hypothetical protein